jgi:hypothetical protein
MIAGGDSIDGLTLLRSDSGLSRLMNKMMYREFSKKERRTIERLQQKGKLLSPLPSPSVAHRWLNLFHNNENACLRRDSGAFIAPPEPRIKSLCDVNSNIVELMQKNKKSTVATLDMDATLIAANKKEARFCYKGFAAYQPLNVWWAEQQMMIHTEFRNGNVNAGYEQLRLLKEAIKLLPEDVSEIRVRSDSAGYQHEFMDFCQFVISNKVTEEFKNAALQIPDKDWRPVYRNKPLGNKFFKTILTGQEWAEIAFVPNKVAVKNPKHIYRYIAIREPLNDSDLSDAKNKDYPFPVYVNAQKFLYKLHGIVTNIPMPEKNVEKIENRGRPGEFNSGGMWGESVIHWHRERCGRSEQAHSIIKSDFGGGKMPSGKFGVNAAWWWISIMAMNLQKLMTLAMDEKWENSRMSAPSTANVIKLDNPAHVKANHQHGTESCV